MTENEIREFVQSLRNRLETFIKSGWAIDGLINDYTKSADTIEKLFEEIQQYRAIGTVEEFKALKDCGTHDCIIKHLTNECSYKETGCSDCKSIEMIRTAVERMKPKKPTHQGCYDDKGVWHTWNGINGVPYDLCPNCNINLCTDGYFGRDKNKLKYCENCGQALDWSE